MGVTKGQTQVIDEQAVKVFKNSLPEDGWTIFDISPDRGLDQRIEVVEDEKHTGKAAYVQIKGRRTLRKAKTGSYVSQKLEVEHLDYYVGMTQPVFLVVVDVDRREGYWVFLQEYERARLGNVDWRAEAANGGGKRPKITIRVPTSDRLSDEARLRSAVEDAIGFMARQGIASGIRHGRERFRALDPRFDARITATERGEVVDFAPLDDVHVDLTFSPTFCDSGGFEDLVGRGLPVRIGPGDVGAEGSPLVQSILQEAADREGIIQLCARGRGNVRLSRLDPSGAEVGRPHELECTFEGGLTEARFLARTPYDLLTFSGVLSSEGGGPSPIDIGCNLAAWLGRPLSSLPYFGMVHDLLGCVEEGGGLKVEFFVDATCVYSGFTRWERPVLESSRSLLGLVELVGRAEWVARKYGLDATLPRRFEPEHVREITTIYRLARGEEIRLRGAVDSACIRLARWDERRMSKVIGRADEPQRLSIISKQPQPFLGIKVDIGAVETELSHVRLGVDRRVIEGRARGGTDPVSLTFAASPETEMVIRMASDLVLRSLHSADDPEGDGA